MRSSMFIFESPYRSYRYNVPTVKRLLLVLIPAALCAQSTLEQGRALFRSNCAFCHDMTATGGRGPNLVSAPLSHGDTDQAIQRVIRLGVPGTTMPAFDLGADEVSQITEYLRGLTKNATRQDQIPGDAQAGKQIYAKSGCIGCHRVDGQGSIFGPELTRIGASRSIEYLRESIVKPSADVPEMFQGVSAVMKDGKRVRGIRINEDTFSLQVRDQSQKIRMFDKSDLRDVVYETQSLMPAYVKLAAADLDNLVAYLAGLRGPVDSSATVKKAGGIK